MKSHKERVNEENRINPKLRSITGDELTRLKEVLLEIFIDVKNMCERNGLRYMLVGGSALGAVRHKGFIPWDDDFDMCMPRKDYEKFKELFNKELGDKYVLNAPNCEMPATNRFPKVLKKGTKFIEAGMEDDERACIKIDIFILENVPNNSLVKIFRGIICTSLMFIGGKVLSYESIKRSENSNKSKAHIRTKLMGALFSFRPSYKWFNSIDKACQYYDDNSDYANLPTGRKHYFGEILKRDLFLPVSDGSFEGVPVKLPGNVSAYLTNLYGDYMEIPPENKREKHYVESISFGEIE